MATAEHPRFDWRPLVEGVVQSPRHLVEEVGDMTILTGKTVLSAVRPPYPYGGELVSQFLLALRPLGVPPLGTPPARCCGGPRGPAPPPPVVVGALRRLVWGVLRAADPGTR